MASGLTLDTGALIAAEKRSEGFWAVWKVAVERRVRVTLPSGVLAQAWRGNCPVIARLIPVCDVEALDEEKAKKVGTLLARTGTADVVDAAVVVGAAARGDAILTSDHDDIARLVEKAAPGLRIIDV